MHAAELAGWRIIATPVALDAVTWPKGSRVVRISPDDVFGLVREIELLRSNKNYRDALGERGRRAARARLQRN